MVENIATLNLQRSIQACIDMAQVVIAYKKLSLPNSYKMCFTILAKENILSSQTAEKMEKIVGFRNIAVHEYQEINKNILKNILDHHFGDFKEFYDQILKIFNNLLNEMEKKYQPQSILEVATGPFRN
jgi:uncharacterized protein YutE (UPF0331/DUF86 family)